MINFVHGTLYGILVDPYPPLRNAGIAPSQSVLEVGCGPGHFTGPASELVGPLGKVVAIDINPVAVNHVRHKVEGKQLKNVDVLVADASNTGLPASSFDLALLFGVVHDLDMTKVLPEMRRLLRDGGTLAMTTSGRSAGSVAAAAEGYSFRPLGKTGRVHRFIKETH
jgi:ubiquinone/menaquinone biosynthesis C-methylase UbiE